jgi:hypothetical protein
MRNNESNIFLDLSQMLEFHEKSYTFINQGEKCIMDFQLSSKLLKRAHSVKFKKRVIDPNTYKHKHIILRKTDAGKQYKRYKKHFDPNIDLTLEQLIEKYKLQTPKNIEINEDANCVELIYKIEGKHNSTVIFELHINAINSWLAHDLKSRYYREFFLNP